MLNVKVYSSDNVIKQNICFFPRQGKEVSEHDTNVEASNKMKAHMANSQLVKSNCKASA